MNNKVNIPQDYKKTPIGIIPNDWDVKRLGELVSLKSGESPTSFTLHKNGKYPFVKVEDMNNCDKVQLHSREYSNDKKDIIPKGSIIFPKRGAAITNNKVRLTGTEIQMDSNMMAMIVSSNRLLNQFLFYQIVHEKLYRIADTSTIPQINNKHIIPYKIALPPLPEQKKIAEILNLWDKAIEKQSELITQLELRKKGLMQQLLTGKKRLPGFKGKWIAKKMQDICILKSNFAISREQMNYSEGNICSIHYGDVLIRYPNILDIEKESIPYINKEISRNISFKDFIEEGDIIMSDTAEDETVGRACEIINLNNRKLTAGLHTFLIHPQIKFAKAFLGYYLNSNRYRQQIIPLIQGIKVSSITKKSLLSTYIEIPSIEEQNAIANILMQADEEIENIQKKLEYLRTQKRGLMQQLLTGKIRVN